MTLFVVQKFAVQSKKNPSFDYILIFMKNENLMLEWVEHDFF